jgi:hypothetical protein
MKVRLKKEHSRRLRIILKFELNARNKITAIGALAVPALRYSFGVINWRLEEINNDRKSRKILTVYKMHHPKAAIDRLYVKRKGREIGLLQTEVTYKAQIINIAEYLNIRNEEDQFVKIVKSHKSNQRNMNSTTKQQQKSQQN